MTAFDFEISLSVWLLSMIASVWFPLLLPVVAATTFNLWHQRKTLYEAGKAFEQRVRSTLTDDLQAAENRLKAMEKAVEDIKEAQMKIAGAFRGRNLPL